MRIKLPYKTEKTERNKLIYEMAMSGKKFEEIALEFNLTRQRVWKIYKRQLEIKRLEIIKQNEKI